MYKNHQEEGLGPSRLAAQARGAIRYTSERSCRWGHLGERFTKNGVCCTCSKERNIARDPNLDPIKVHKRFATIAREQGHTRYMSPFPCPNGHHAQRTASDAKCVVCAAERHRDYMADPAVAKKQKERQAEWREQNREHVLSEKKRWYEENKERHHQRTKEWLLENKDKHREYQRVCRQRRPEVYRAHSKARHRRYKQAAVPHTDMRRVRQTYLLCPVGYHVDHIVPLKAKNASGEHVASGLHVHQNLQYLTVAANSAKSNNWSGSGSFDSNAIVPFSWEHFLVISEQA